MKLIVHFSLVVLLFIYSVIAGNTTLPVNQLPVWDLCAKGGDIFSCSGHGSCSGGKCLCVDGYSGNDCSIPKGGFNYTLSIATVTQFCELQYGGCSAGMCIGGGTLTNANLPPGVDGVAAVNPTVYGSRFAYASAPGQGIDRTLNGMYTTVGQACGTCWRLIKKPISIVVTVVDRCAGYCRATVDTPQVCEASSLYGAEECGECIQKNQPSVPQCSCLSPDSTKYNGFCYGKTTAHCDWCASNDHPHFDLDNDAMNKICGSESANGHCNLDSFQMIACPDLIGPWPNGYYNGSHAPSTSSATSSGSSSGTVSTTGGPNCGGYKNANGGCTPLNNGDYVCNGCSLNICDNGRIQNIGCAAGTVCQKGQCVVGGSCDPALTPCTPSLFSDGGVGHIKV